ncbi:hypothetical protein CDL12_07712 [Handroanthus impetiginosus]|uniref:Uncharacterized protein n=1 Tax=Handroanthus impetiginosus TaxID=429701 RepID=A0A2G9HQP3_9LAMI|nr:hypothetical protein CDL12_07712 [Handroanthus impetiginosus]
MATNISPNKADSSGSSTHSNHTPAAQANPLNTFAPPTISSISLSPPHISPTANTQLLSINIATQALPKLIPTNFQSWIFQWQTLREGYDFLKYVETPPKDQPSTIFWIHQDRLIKSTPGASLSLEIISFVIDVKTSYDIWQILQKTYAKPTHARIRSLRETLQIKQLAATLATVHVTISMYESVLHVLHGLPPEYCEIIATIRAREIEISFEEFHDKLTDFESYLSHDGSYSTTPITTNLTTKLPTTHTNSKWTHAALTTQEILTLAPHRTTTLALQIKAIELFANTVINLLFHGCKLHLILFPMVLVLLSYEQTLPCQQTSLITIGFYIPKHLIM